MMNIRVRKEEVVRALKDVNVIPPVKSLPILDGILVTVNPKEITFTRTDLTYTAQQNVECETEDKGKFLVNAKVFDQIIKNSDDVIEMKANEKDGVKIGKYKIPLLPVEEYPVIDTKEEVKETIICRQNFSRVIPFVSNDETNFALMNAYFGKGNIYATDGKRLIRDKICEFQSSFFLNPLLLKNDIEKITVKKTRIEVETITGAVFSQRVIDAQFPDVETIIKELKGELINFDKDAMLDLIYKTLPLVANDELAVKIEVSDKITVSKESSKGQFKDSIECNSEGKNIAFAVNPFYMIDFLKALPVGEIYVSESDRPIFYKKMDLVVILMPMNI